MNCSICGRRITLEPSAAARARKYGAVPEDYIRLFTAHADCVVKKRERETLELIERGALAPQNPSEAPRVSGDKDVQ